MEYAGNSEFHQENDIFWYTGWLEGDCQDEYWGTSTL
jgi:hypothetical protein